MSSGTTPWRGPAPHGRRRSWLGAGIAATVRLLALYVLLLAGAALLVALIAPLAIAGALITRVLLRPQGEAAFAAKPGPYGQVVHAVVATGPDMPGRGVVALAVLLAGITVTLVLLPYLLLAIRRLAWLTRRVVASLTGMPTAGQELPLPGTYGAPVRYWRRLGWLLSDPATARDLRWTVLNSVLGWIPTLLPAGLVTLGLIGFIGPVARFAVPPPAFPGNHAPVLVVLGIAIIAAGLGSAPWLLRGYGLAAGTLLAPAGQAELAQRVQHLAQTRSEAIDTGAAEMRRIERDLHDGAQARLVAMGMTLDAAGQLIDDNPAAARALLLEARDASVRALNELRDLVRGIHPPVLADRGLADAVRALVLDTPVRARLAADLPGRLPAPVESAAYFAVSELLANVAKHAEASQAWVDIRHADGILRIGVSDNGCGGANPACGTGLRGIERRLAAFDGVLAVSSPPGGPTAVTMEIPCALSSPKTSFC
ncbi:MAG: histidine kinase [Streptosporangiaceae bacterium]